MPGDRIVHDSDTARGHGGRMKSAAESITRGSAIRPTGQNHQAAEQTFHRFLTHAASALGNSAEWLRKDLAQNGDALLEAAETMLARNAISTQTAQEVTALITGAPGAVSPDTTTAPTYANDPDARH